MQAKRFVAVDMRRALSIVREELGEDAMILSTQRTAKGVEIVATAEEVPVQSMALQKLQSTSETRPLRSESLLSKGSVSKGLTSKGSVSKSLASKDLISKSLASKGLAPKGLASGKTKEELALEMEVARRRMMAVKKQNNVTLGEWASQENPVTPLSAKSQADRSQADRFQSGQLQSGHPQLEVPQSQMDQWLQSPRDVVNDKHAVTDDMRGNQHSCQQSNQYAHQHVNQQAGLGQDVQKDNEEIRRLQDEISTMRELFESQLHSMAEAQEQRYQDQLTITDMMPVITDVKRQLTQLGLTQACNDKVIRSLRTIDTPSMNAETLWAEGLARLSRNIPVITSDPIATGGIYAFLGTTGVGKTTTIAKLAARYVMEHGAQEVVLLTTDTFRIGAHDQLRSLGHILNVQVKVVDDIKQLPKILTTFSRQALVLIDTPGMSYNDPLLKEHLAVLKQCRHVQNALVLSANSQYQMMQASIHSYRIAHLRFCVMTKLDECASLGDAISVLAMNSLPLGYITNGQAVPDDLDVIKAHQLISKAVKLTKTATHFCMSQPQKSI